jgi:hypothetical protein
VTGLRLVRSIHVPTAVPDFYAGMVAASQQPVGADLHLRVGFTLGQASRRDVIGGVEKVIAIDRH